MKKVSKRVGIVKKAQTGVQVPKEAEKKEFTYLTSKEKGAGMRAKKAAAVKANDSLKATAKVKKAQSGTSLGMKSVKAGVDSNPGVTRADIITAGKQNAGKAKGGKKLKGGGAVSYSGAAGKTGFTGSGTYSPSDKNVGKSKKQAKFKSGGKMTKKCMGGC
jgi:hypothetical protein